MEKWIYDNWPFVAMAVILGWMWYVVSNGTEMILWLIGTVAIGWGIIYVVIKIKEELDKKNNKPLF